MIQKCQALSRIVKHVYIGSLSCVLAFFIASDVKAQTFEYPSAVFTDSLSLKRVLETAGDDTIEVAQGGLGGLSNATQGSYMGLNYTVKSVFALTKFKVDVQSDKVKDKKKFTYMISYKTIGFINQTAKDSTALDTLTVSYDRDSLQLINDRSFKIAGKYHKVFIIIKNVYEITGTGTSLTYTQLTPLVDTNIPRFVFIHGEIHLQRYIHHSNLNMTGVSATNNINTDGTVLVSWNSMANIRPAAYEVEWTYVSQYAAQNYDFRHNSTRIFTNKTEFKIPVAQKEGYLVYRVRMVRPHLSDLLTRSYGAWTLTADNGSISGMSSGLVQIQPSISDSLNWDLKMSFVEDGKYKQVITYYDGLLKPKQVQTRFNSKPNQTIVAQTLYDFEGRPVINSLPIPVNGVSKFSYQSRFMRPAGSAEYAKSMYDSIPDPNICPPKEVAIEPLDTAAPAAKYYARNNPDKTGKNAFIPDAEGYPFVRKILSPENSEKVLFEGKAGSALQLGNDRHMSYLYGTPIQAELNRYFGQDVGKANYYRKMITTDNHGQDMFSITDDEGRIVASGLIDVTDTSALAIDIRNLPDSQHFFSNLLPIPDIRIDEHWRHNGSYFVERKANYEFTYGIDYAPFKPCPSINVGLSPKVYFNYDIIDPCGITVLSHGGVLGNTGVIDPWDMVDTSSAKSVLLEKGKHVWNKYAYVKLDDMRASVDAYLDAGNGCFISYDSFYKAAFIESNFPCVNNYDPCSALRLAMIKEMYPLAKYGKYTYTDPTSKLFVSEAPNSIFTKIPNTDLYKYQAQCIKDTVYVRGKAVPLKSTFPQDLIPIFNDSIAAALLPLHPDYCKLQLCNVINHPYAKQLGAIKRASDAISISRFVLADITANDPVYTNSLLTQAELSRTVDDSLKIDSIAFKKIICGSEALVIEKTCAEINAGKTPADITAYPAEIQDAYYNKLIELYQQNRESRLGILLSNNTDSCGPCAALRLTDPDGGSPFDNESDTSFLVKGMDSLNKNMDMPGNSSFNNYFDPNTLGNINEDSLHNLQNADNSAYCKELVASIVKSMQACNVSQSVLNALRDTLEVRFCTNNKSITSLSYDSLTAIMTQVGISSSDLCNAGLVDIRRITRKSHDYVQLGLLQYKPAYYTDLRNFIDSSGLFTFILSGADTMSVNLKLCNSYPFQQYLAKQLGSGLFPLNCSRTATTLLVKTNLVNSNAVKLAFTRNGDTVAYFLYPSAKSEYNSLDTVFNTTKLSAPGNYVTKSLFHTYGFDKVSKSFANRNTTLLYFDATKNSVQRKFAYFLSAFNVESDYNMMEKDQPNYLNGIGCSEFIPMATAAITQAQQLNIKLGHPYFEKYFTNVINDNNAVNFDFTNYHTALQTCGLSDSITIQKHIAHFRIKFPTTHDVDDIAAFVDSLKKPDTIGVADAKTYHMDGYDYLLLDVNETITRNMKDIKAAVSARVPSGSVVEYMPYLQRDTVAELFVYDVEVPNMPLFKTALQNTFPGVTVAEDGLNMHQIIPGVGKFNLTGTRFTLTNTITSNYHYSHLVDSIYKFVRTNAPMTTVFNHAESAVSGQYHDWQMTAWRNYVMGLTTQNHNELVKKSKAEQFDTISASGTGGSFTTSSFSYVNNRSPYFLNNLYIDHQPTSNTNYSYIKDVLEDLEAYNTSYWGKKTLLYPLHSSLSFIPNIPNLTSGTETRPYLCGDTTQFWINHFDANHKMINIFIQLPNYLPLPRETYELVSVSKGAEKDTVSYVIITMAAQNGSGVKDTIHCIGYTNKNLGATYTIPTAFLSSHSKFETLSGKFENCETKRLQDLHPIARISYARYRDSVRNLLVANFRQHIIDSLQEYFTIKGNDIKHGITLYYYDMAGNLVMTIPPAGVASMNVTDPHNTNINNARVSYTGGTPTQIPAHTKPTTYKYNAQDKVIQTQTPDAGIVTNLYDPAGRVVVSQNAQQAVSNSCTYFMYDNLSRVIETGKIRKNPSWDAKYFSDFNNLIGFYSDVKASLSREEITVTMYDTASYTPAGPVFGILPPQENLKNRVSCTKYFEAAGSGVNLSKDTGYVHALHYSYDISGNVKTLIHDLRNEAEKMLRFKRVDYEYDLYSGKVIMLAYNRGYADQMFQKYTYDNDNRITDVYTSNNGVYWDRDANYRYYDHGPLARTELGEQRVQGVDYAYTINGWLKAVNGIHNDSLSDMGGDGATLLVMPKDVFSQRIDYFAGDYKAIGDSNTFRALPATNKSLYNGNIAGIAIALTPFDNMHNKYHYDPLQRIARADYASYTVNNSTSPASSSSTALADYASKYKYDADGNILELERKGGYIPAHLNGGTAITMQPMDALKYHYYGGTNKLKSLADVCSTTVYKIDIPRFTVDTAAARYTYDNNGNLITDVVSDITNITWTNSGKVKSITKLNGTKLHFTYDALGNRLTKDVVLYPATDSMVKLKTLYVRDASGNILAVYDDKKEYDITKITYPLLANNAPFGPATSGPITKPLTTVLAAQLTDLHVNAPSTHTFAKLAMVLPTLSEYAETSGTMQNLISSLDQGQGLSFVKSLPAITEYTLTAPNGAPVTGDKLSLYMQGVMLSEDLDDLKTDVFVALKNNNTVLYNNTVATIPATAQEKANFPTDMAMLSAYNGMELGDKLAITNTLSGALTGADIATLPYIRSVMLDAYSTSNTYGNFITELPDADVILDNIKQDAVNYAAHRYTLAEQNEVPLATVQGEFNANAVLASVLSTGIDAEAEGLSEILNMHWAASVSLAGTSSQGSAFAGALKTVLLGNATLIDQAFPYGWTKTTTVMTKQRQHLAEHHLYGSSRVGLQKYLPQQIQYEYSLPDTGKNSLNTLTVPKTWYSLYGGDLFHWSANNNTLLGTATMDIANLGVNSHVLGNRHYELTNHLGNVQSVVLDRATPKFKLSDSTVQGYTSDINLAHDYYPFGMLMPGRYIADTAQRCVTVNTTVLVPKYQKIYIELTAAPATQHTGGGNGTFTPTHKLPKKAVQAQEHPHVYHYREASTHPNGTVITGAMVNGNRVYNISLSEEESNAVSAFVHIHADTTVEAQDVGFDLDLPQDVIAEVRVRQYVDTSEEYVEALTWSTISQSSAVSLTVPINKAYVKAGGPTLVEMRFSKVGNVPMDPGTFTEWKNYWVKLTHYEPQTRVVQICEEKDNYRFGFNGQEKDNEAKGIGNSLNFKYRMHDSRIGRFMSIDPLTSKYPYYSSYQFAGNTPIWARELEGLEPIVNSGEIIGYKVQKGQGPIAILKDIENKETQKKYGYSLPIKIIPADIISDNPQYFKNVNSSRYRLDLSDAEYSKLDLNVGDKLNLFYYSALVSEYKRIGNIIQNYQVKINENNRKISVLESKIKKLDEELEIMENSIDMGADGDVGRASAYGSISAKSSTLYKQEKYEKEIKKLKNENESLESVKESAKELKKQLETR